MSNDREMLEMAAKAIGMDALYGGSHGMQERRQPDGEYAWTWNPLTSDGDALRLAVKLDMGIEIMRGMEEVRVGNGDQEIVVESWAGPDAALDPSAATRRAITRAAAAIGAGMGEST